LAFAVDLLGFLAERVAGKPHLRHLIGPEKQPTIGAALRATLVGGTPA